MSTHPPPRVAVVDDHSLFAEALEIALRLEALDPRCVPVTTEHSSASLLNRILDVQPAIALIDLNLGPHGDGGSLVRPLSEAGIATVVVTASTHRDQWGACLASGARVVIPKLAPLKDIVATIRRIHQGLPVISSQERAELLQAWREQVASERDARARLDRLTPREAEVLDMLMTGLQVRDIAQKRLVGESTVRTQVKSILAKLQVSSQLSAVGLANGVGWRPPHQAPNRTAASFDTWRRNGSRAVHQR